MAASPPKKKPKYSYDVEPGVMSGARSASELAKGQGNDAAFHIRAAPLHAFFPDSSTSAAAEGGLVVDESVSESQILTEANRQKANIKIGPAIRLALNEKAYRNAIYRQFTDNKKGNLETAPGTSERFSYKEIDLIGLFQAFLEVNTTDGNGDDGDGAFTRINSAEKEALVSSFRQKEHGLKITTTSLPDLSFLRHMNGVVEFVLGEVKHASKYTWENAKQQAACYLQALLYFLRVKIGLPVTAVHGFTVCGSKCSGIGSTWSTPKYAVGFVKLVAPQTLDGRFQVSSNWQIFDAKDPAGLELLVHFLKHGNSFEYQQLPVLWEARRDLPDRCPSLFTAPPVLWEDTDERELVVNGTLAVVFRVRTLDAAKGLLDMVVGTGEERQDRDARDAQVSLEGVDFINNAFVYVKVHTTETVNHLNTSTFRKIWTRLEDHGPRSSPAVSDFFRTYPMQPPSVSPSGFIVMYDRGESLLSADLSKRFLSFSGARPKLVALRSNVDELGEICFHGDILPHNVAVDEEGNLALFDYDGAVLLTSDPPKRVIPDTVNVYRLVSYPNILRGDYKKDYSAVQFSVIVRVVAEALECSQRESESLSTLRSIHSELAVTLNEEIVNKVPKQILLQVERLAKAVDSMLAEEDTAAALLN